MTATRLWHARGAWVAGILAVAGMALVAPPAAAVQAGSLVVSPSQPIPGERVVLDGTLPPRSRPVTLQKRNTNGSWGAVSSKTSSADGSFTFPVTAPAQVGRTEVYRVAAPRVKLNGTVHPAVETPPQTITTVRQSGTLAMPTTASPGEDIPATATFSPARQGRPVILQRRNGTQWSRIATGTQGADGSASFTVTAEQSGTTGYRARTLVFANAPAIGTPVQTVTVAVDDDTTAPPVPGPVTSEAGDGTVHLGWPAVSADDLAGYHVSIADQPGGPWTRLTATPQSATTYDATGLDDARSYSFAVSSIDTTGNESERSTAVTTTTWLPVVAGVSAGHQHSCRVDADGSASCWGANTDGQLGDGTSKRRPVQTAVSGGGAWSTITTGEFNTCGVQRDGSLWCWGDNQLGQLGNGTASTFDQRTPSRVGSDSDWQRVVLGKYFACATKTDATAWCWGYGGRGELGNGTTENRHVPTQLEGEWSQLAAGDSHACGIRTDRSLWCWGSGGNGQLGLGDRDLGSEQRLTEPARVGDQEWSELAAAFYQSCAIRQDGTLWCWGFGSSGALGNGTTDFKVTAPRQAGTATDWESITTAQGKSCGLRADGQPWCWGNSAFPEPQTAPTVVPTVVPTDLRFAQLDAGSSHTCGTTLDGATACWGYNNDGQLGNGHSDREVSPVQVGNNTDWAAMNVAGASSSYSTCALKEDASAWCWGMGYYGALGNGSTDTQVTPGPVDSTEEWAELSAGEKHVCGRTTGGELWCWGENESRQLGDGTTTDRPAPVRTGNDSDWVLLNAGDDATCAIKADGTLWCWGYMPGSGTIQDTPTQVGTETTWATVDVGRYFACGTRTDGTAWCWGWNDFGQLGDGTKTERPSPVQVGTDSDWSSVTAGSQQACGLRTDGSAWCWGRNDFGAAGIGSSYGETLTPMPVLGGHEWAELVTGNARTCGIDTDGAGWCWGHNFDGGLGIGIDDGDRHYEPTRVVGGGTWTSFAINQAHVCGTKGDGTLWCWGSNGYLGFPLTRFDPQPIT